MQALKDCFGLVCSLVGMLITAEWFPKLLIGMIIAMIFKVGPTAFITLAHGQDAIAREQQADNECKARVFKAGYVTEAQLMDAMSGADAYEETGLLAFKIAPPAYKVATITITKNALPKSEVQLKKAEADMGISALKQRYCSDLFPTS